MAAPTVHLLETASFGATTFPDAQAASIDEGGSVAEYTTAGATDVKLVGVDRRAATVQVTVLGYYATPEIGDAGALTLTMKARAEGKGTTGAAVTKTWPNAVCTGKGSGPTIEGSPSYSLTFRAHAAP